MSPLQKEQFALFILFLITGIWGSTFVVIKDAGTALSPWSLNAWRFMIAALLLFLICAARKSRFTKGTWVQGSFLGALLFLAFALQTFGLEYTMATNSAFLTGWNALIVPGIAYVLLKQRISLQTWLGIIAALCGSWLLLSDAHIQFNVGDTLTMGCAFIFALHICFLSQFTKKTDLYVLSFTQVFSCAVLFVLMTYLSDVGLEGPLALEYWKSLVYLGTFATVLTFTFQTYIQKFVEPSKVALVFATEPLWGALFAWQFLGERIPTLGYVGGLLMVFGIIIAELPLARFRKRTRERNAR